MTSLRLRSWRGSPVRSWRGWQSPWSGSPALFCVPPAGEVGSALGARALCCACFSFGKGACLPASAQCCARLGEGASQRPLVRARLFGEVGSALGAPAPSWRGSPLPCAVRKGASQCLFGEGSPALCPAGPKAPSPPARPWREREREAWEKVLLATPHEEDQLRQEQEAEAGLGGGEKGGGGGGFLRRRRVQAKPPPSLPDSPGKAPPRRSAGFVCGLSGGLPALTFTALSRGPSSAPLACTAPLGRERAKEAQTHRAPLAERTERASGTPGLLPASIPQPCASMAPQQQQHLPGLPAREGRC